MSELGPDKAAVPGKLCLSFTSTEIHEISRSFHAEEGHLLDI